MNVARLISTLSSFPMDAQVFIADQDDEEELGVNEVTYNYVSNEVTLKWDAPCNYLAEGEDFRDNEAINSFNSRSRADDLNAWRVQVVTNKN